MTGSDAGGTEVARVPLGEQAEFCLTDDEVVRLAHAACLIEASYSKAYHRRSPMDIEWARDGLSGEITIVQARPETVHLHDDPETFELFGIDPGRDEPLVTGQAVGVAAASGNVCLVRSDDDLDRIRGDSVIVASATMPHWETAIRQAAAVVTDQGGRTAHAAIVSREMGLTCVVGTGNATQLLQEGESVTVSCCEGAVGRVYQGALPISHDRIRREDVPKTKTKVMVNIGDPNKAFRLARYPCSGVGLARMEFIIVAAIGIHPLAAIKYPWLRDEAAVRRIGKKVGKENARHFFVRRLSEGIAKIAAAFYPRPVILRTSDFKSNEYARLIGGTEFEKHEENPMLGLRGASRYCHPLFSQGFSLECEAIKIAREEMGLTNLKVMVPFCRTPEEGRRVLSEMAKHGLVQGEGGLEVLVMCELPSNVLEAEDFLAIFDGFSIGSNDLTQLTLGVDRDSTELAEMFDEREPSVKHLLALAITAGRKLGKPVGICGQGPADHPELAQWLVSEGITSISVNPDSVVPTIAAVHKAEQRRAGLRRPKSA